MAKSKETDGKQIVQQLNQDHAAVMLGGKFVILTETINPATGYSEIQFSTVPDLKNFYRNRKVKKLVNDNVKMVNPADIWLDHQDRRQYRGVVFAPDNPPKGYYNLWKGFAAEPKHGYWSRFYNHIFENICGGNSEYCQWVLDWMADAVQRPAERPGTSIVLRGPQGTGKGVFASNFGKIFGSHFVHVSGQHRLTGKFNTHLKMALLVFVDEGFWAGDKRDAGTLKAMVTEETLLVEPKFQDAFPLRNHIRVIMASNNDWVVPADLEERRFCVLDVSARHRMDVRYFGAIIEEMENGGREALLYDLLDREISSNLREIPRTQALFEQMMESMSSLEKWWLSCLQEEKISPDDEWWPECLLPSETYELYMEHCRQNKLRHPVGFPPFFTKLRKLCPGILRKKMDRGAGRHNYLCFPFIDECRQSFEERVNIPINWESGEIIC